MKDRIALNSWTLDTTDVLGLPDLAGRTGYLALELRMADFNKLANPDDAVAAVKTSGLAIASLGADGVLVQADAAAQAQWFERLAVAAEIANRIDCDTIMVSTGMVNATTVAEAAEIIHAAAQLLVPSGVRLAYEFNAFHPSLNTLTHALALLNACNRKDVGLALDSYHMQQSASWDHLADIQAQQLFCVQLSDVPRPGATGAAAPLDRLPPGQGVIDWRTLFRFLDAINYRSRVSFEAPNPATWERDPETVARDGLSAISALWGASRRG